MASLRCIVLFTAVSVLFFAQQGFSQNFVGEGLLVLDPRSIERFQAEENSYSDAVEAAKHDVEFMVTRANEYYDSLQQYGLNLQISIADIQVLDESLVSRNEIFNGDVVNPKTILDHFGEWLTANDDTAYDFAVLLTGYNLEDPTAGIAQLAKMCNPYARGVVEFHGMMSNAGVFAHEVGHIFGADHDPDGDYYIMAPKGSNEKDTRTFEFSQLSANMIKNLLPQTSKCLRVSSSSSEIPSVTGAKYTGKMHDFDAMCVRALGPKSTPCTSSTFYGKGDEVSGDDVCFHLACRSPDDPESCITSIQTPEGMACGKGKACHLGKCVDNNDAKYNYFDNQCLFGDDKNPLGDGQTCSDIIEENGAPTCSQSIQRTRCCETCSKYETGIKGCEYGDVKSFTLGTEKTTCAQQTESRGRNSVCLQLDDFCCGTCQVPVSQQGQPCPFGDDNFLDFNGKMQTCAQIKQDESLYAWDGMCSSDYINKRCCGTCGSEGYMVEKTSPQPEPASTPADTPEPASTPDDTPDPASTPADTHEPASTPADTPEPASTPADTPEPAPAPTGCTDTSGLLYGGEPATCSGVAKMNGRRTMCSLPDFARLCCATCQKKGEKKQKKSKRPKTSPPSPQEDCRDEDSFILNNQRLNCDIATNNYGINTICRDPQLSTQFCCQTCKKLPNAPADCPWGNDYGVIVNSNFISCDQADTYYTRDWLCKNLAQECCEICA